MHKCIWSVICMNGYSIYLQIGNNCMCRLNIYFAHNRQWIIQMGCNWTEVYSVIHCFGLCSAWYVYYFTRPRYGSGCIWVNNIVSETVGSPWLNNHCKFSFFADMWSLYITTHRVLLDRKNTSFKLESVNVFYFIIHWGAVKSRKSHLSIIICSQVIYHLLLILFGKYFCFSFWLGNWTGRLTAQSDLSKQMQPLLGFHLTLLVLENLSYWPGCFPRKRKCFPARLRFH